MHVVEPIFDGGSGGYTEASSRSLRFVIVRKSGKNVLLELNDCGFRVARLTWRPDCERRHYEVGDLVNLRVLSERHARLHVDEIPASLQNLGDVLRRTVVGGSAPTYLVGHRILAIRPRRRLDEQQGLRIRACLDGELEIAPVVVIEGIVLQSERRPSRVNLRWLTDRVRDDGSQYAFWLAVDARGAAVAEAAISGPRRAMADGLRRSGREIGRRQTLRLARRSGWFRRLLRDRQLRGFFVTNVAKLIRRGAMKATMQAAKAGVRELDRLSVERNVLAAFGDDTEARRALERDPRLRQVVEKAAVAFVSSIGSEIVAGLIMDGELSGGTGPGGGDFEVDEVRTELAQVLDRAKDGMQARTIKFFAQDVPKSFLKVVTEAAIRREEPRIPHDDARFAAAVMDELPKGLTAAIEAALAAGADEG
jgi:hypothetical protein